MLKRVLGKDFHTRVIRYPGGYWSWNGWGTLKERLIDKGYVDIFWNSLNKDTEGYKKNVEELLYETERGVEALGPEADSIVFWCMIHMVKKKLLKNYHK